MTTTTLRRPRFIAAGAACAVAVGSVLTAAPAPANAAPQQLAARTISCANDVYRGEFHFEPGAEKRSLEMTGYRLTVPSEHRGKTGEIWVFENASYRSVISASSLAQTGALVPHAASGVAYTQQLVAKFTFAGSKKVLCETMFTV